MNFFKVGIGVLSAAFLVLYGGAIRHSKKFHPEDENKLLPGISRIAEQFSHIDYFGYRISISDLTKMRHMSAYDIDAKLKEQKYILTVHEMREGAEYYEWKRVDTSNGMMIELGEVQYSVTGKGFKNIVYQTVESEYYSDRINEMKSMKFEERPSKNKYGSLTEYFVSPRNEMIIVETVHHPIQSTYTFLIMDLAEMLVE